MLRAEYVKFLNEYYLMCELSEEVQKQAPDSSDCAGATFLCPSCHGICEEDTGMHFCHTCICDDPKYVWIPDQHNLQEMGRVKINDDVYENDYSLSKRFTEFIPGHKESTMEQLWLMLLKWQNLLEKFQTTGYNYHQLAHF